MSEAAATVFVIDDDSAVRDSLATLLRAAGLPVRTYESARTFLREFRPEHSGCLMLDIRMPGMSGLELQEELNQRRCRLPIIFLTGHGDVPTAVRALKRGAFDFIEKPHDEQRLVLATRNALRAEAEQRAGLSTTLASAADLDQRLALLSMREREVLEHVLEGRPTRTIADILCVSVKTVEFHRSRIREKLRVGSLAELFRLFLTHEEAMVVASAPTAANRLDPTAD
ncbi:MAG TPA: response regulator [Accumulibacter sp.]|uniref:response regulator transcription factor n=1 Tax=Accumulibacter sp. TaxID=2053492 RepID=UPI0025E49C24|nr:response regulator [Accumulibacter sp.]MCM8597048.1 response regulator [Accumulibacter sp.]MCM8663671.1 response regulator [Accumulibacter sp.]HNC51070.1 response regulator [Accumulibacter sp.]